LLLFCDYLFITLKGTLHMKSRLSRTTFLLCALFILSLFFILETATPTPASSQEIAAASVAPERWRWQHPQPQGNNLSTIHCPTELYCYAGSNAIIIQSKDGNKSWSVQKPPAEGVSAVYCPAADICYGAGYSGYVLKTTDGGQSWSAYPTNSSKPLWGIYCSSTQNCIAVGQEGIIQQTTDGGLTWQSRASNTTLNLRDITCPTASICLAIGGNGVFGFGNGVVRRSQDGGVSWQAVTGDIDNVLSGITCKDATACILVGWSGLIRVSHDAGSSWHHASAHTSSNLTDIACPTAAKCFITSNGGNIYYSNDGYIWLELDIENDVLLVSISCPSPQHCTAVGSNGLLLSTKNGGIDWLSHNEGTLTSEREWYCYPGYCGQEYTNRINDLECFADGRCLAVGHQGKIFYGDVLSSSWSVIELDTVENVFGLSCVQGQTAKTCYAVDSGGAVWKSVNDGAVWQPTATGSSERLFDIDCVTSKTCVAVGEDGFIIRTTNGGASWQMPISPAAFTLFAVACPSTSNCIAVGHKAEAVYSTDGGQNWQQASQPPLLPFGGRLEGIFCQSESDCLAVSRQYPTSSLAYLARTVDGGVTWTAEALEASLGLSDISCTPNGLCKAVGQSGDIFSSEDGGYTWQEVSSSVTGLDLLAVSCLDDGSCFASGDRGAILGAALWPDLSARHRFSGDSFAHNEHLTGHIELVNSGAIPAQQIAVMNTLPAALQASGPITISWGAESTIVTSPVWPDILSGLSITLTPGVTLSIQFPLVVDNPQKEVQTVASYLTVAADGLPRPIEAETAITLAEHASFAPFISTVAPDSCHGPYIDHFDLPDSGWPSGDSGHTAYGYASGEYAILHRQANQWMAVTRRDFWQNDHLVKTSGYQLANSGLWGLVFGLNENWSNFYTFEILPDLQSWYLLNFDAENGWRQIATGSAAHILPGQGKNDLLIQGANYKMYFYINNQLVYEMAERAGYLGLTGGSFTNNTQLRFEYYLFQRRACSVAGAFLFEDDEGIGLSSSFSDDQKISEIVKMQMAAQNQSSFDADGEQ
jgi:photosystem II stability/assembly factor-like uncharacterized protein